jgi:hypothetical protein
MCVRVCLTRAPRACSDAVRNENVQLRARASELDAERARELQRAEVRQRQCGAPHPHLLSANLPPQSLEAEKRKLTASLLLAEEAVARKREEGAWRRDVM